MIGIEMRLRDIFQEDGRALLIDATAGLYGVDFANIRPQLEAAFTFF